MNFLNTVRRYGRTIVDISSVSSVMIAVIALSGCQTTHQKTSACVHCGKQFVNTRSTTPVPGSEVEVMPTPVAPQYVPEAPAAEPVPLFAPGAQANPIEEPAKSTWREDPIPARNASDPFSASVTFPQEEQPIQSVAHTQLTNQPTTAHWPVLHTKGQPLSEQHTPVYYAPTIREQAQFVEPQQWPYSK